MEKLPAEILLRIASHGIDVWRGMLVVPLFCRFSFGSKQIAKQEFARRKIELTHTTKPDAPIIVYRRTTTLGSTLCADNTGIVREEMKLGLCDFLSEEYTAPEFEKTFCPDSLFAIFDYVADCEPGETSAEKSFVRLIGFHKNCTQQQFGLSLRQFYCDTNQPLISCSLSARHKLLDGGMWAIKLKYMGKDRVVKISINRCVDFPLVYRCKKIFIFLAQNKPDEKWTFTIAAEN